MVADCIALGIGVAGDAVAIVICTGDSHSTFGNGGGVAVVVMPVSDGADGVSQRLNSRHIVIGESGSLGGGFCECFK